ncbi:hypothetical protein [Flavobacterium sp. Sd200]|uniref:hypothetical protein n=1 Tax=Flavobacterium sp. Sd200 TaxID=2692211 RepID=UPI001F19D02D|nr:hypothetical protein [Flavobacterium sp. Sd200]
MSLLFAICLQFVNANAQDSVNFWDKVRFGGGIGAAFGSGYTDVAIAPGAIYQFNNYVALGLGVQGSYVRQRDYYESFMYGGSAIVLLNPIPQVQLSAELEQLRVNLNVDERFEDRYPYLNFRDRDFWNTALFVGAGYQMQNVTIGLRYNVLYNKKDMVYSDALMPFIRVYF